MDEDTGAETTVALGVANEDAEEADQSCLASLEPPMKQAELGLTDSMMSPSHPMTKNAPAKSTVHVLDPHLTLLRERLFGPTVLVFASILNAYLPQVGRQRQQKLAYSIGLVSAAISHYRVGRRTPSIEIVHDIAKALDLSIEQEQHLISAWFFDRDIMALRNYFDAITKTKAYDRLPLISMKLDRLYETYFAARHTSGTAK